MVGQCCLQWMITSSIRYIRDSLNRRISNGLETKWPTRLELIPRSISDNLRHHPSCWCSHWLTRTHRQGYGCGPLLLLYILPTLDFWRISVRYGKYFKWYSLTYILSFMNDCGYLLRVRLVWPKTLFEDQVVNKRLRIAPRLRSNTGNVGQSAFGNQHWKIFL